MRISDWSSDVCSSDLAVENRYAPMETSMKQRLLGAVVLIALAIIFVPMFLSGPRQEPASETVDLRIPPPPDSEDRKSVVEGKRVSVSVDTGGRRVLKRKNQDNINAISTNKSQK